MSMANAYAMKKRTKKACYGGKMAEGGQIEDNYESPSSANHQDKFRNMNEKAEYDPKEEPRRKMDRMAMEEDDRDLNQHGDDEMGPDGAYAEGGEIERGMQDAKHMFDMAARVMKSRQKSYSKGGQVANDVGIAEADKEPAEYDDLVLRDDDMEDADYTGENSGDMKGDADEDDREASVLAKVMASRKKKDRMPRPA